MGRKHAVVAIAEPDERSFEVLAGALATAGIQVAVATDAEAVVDLLEAGAVEGAIVNLAMRTGEGASLVESLLEGYPTVPIVAGAESGQTSQGVAAVQNGAADFLQKPYQAEEVAYVLRKVLDVAEHDADVGPQSIVRPDTLMVGGSKQILELQETIRRAANGVATVLVRGESGTGKELVARQIHELSPRRAGPFIRLNCGALPDQLLESELFGHERGAFTGATSRKSGRVELAEGGTLFLDEIGDVTPAVQVKLLRVLQEREYERLGGTETIKADVRFVAATHRPLEEMVKAEKFREDLFYRLNVVPVTVPPLRDRPTDIDELSMHFARTTAEANGRPPASPDASALELLRAEPWPGNVRQLQNFIERLVVLAEGPRFTADDVKRGLSQREGIQGFALSSGFDPPVTAESTAVELAAALKKAEHRALEKALKKAKGNRSLAARILGVSRRTLYNKLEEHELTERSG